MTDVPDLGEHAFAPRSMSRVRAILQGDWDGDGALQRAAAVRDDPDPAAPRTLDELTFALCGLLAAGGTKAEVTEFLLREEEALLGRARASAAERGRIARRAWLAVRGLPDDPEESGA